MVRFSVFFVMRDFLLYTRAMWLLASQGCYTSPLSVLGKTMALLVLNALETNYARLPEHAFSCCTVYTAPRDTPTRTAFRFFLFPRFLFWRRRIFVRPRIDLADCCWFDGFCFSPHFPCCRAHVFTCYSTYKTFLLFVFSYRLYIGRVILLFS